MTKDIKHRLLTVRLPVMPQVLLKLLELAQDDDAGCADFARVVAQDQGIAARLLQVANSAAYARHGSCSTLERAVQCLGTTTTRTLAISQSVSQVFNEFPNIRSADLGPFWLHSLYAALCAQLIARRTSRASPDLAYLGGLLHDVGRLALFAVTPENYASLLDVVDDPELCHTEDDRLGITHADAGAWLISRWQLDSFLADAVLYHHEDIDSLVGAHPLVAIVQLAHLLAHGDAGEMMLELACRNAGLDMAELPEIEAEAAPLLLRIAEDLGIRLPSTATETNQTTPPADPETALAKGVEWHGRKQEGVQLLQSGRVENDLLSAITQAGSLLFSSPAVATFLLDSAGEQLVGAPAANQPSHLAELRIPLSLPRSTLAAALTSQQAQLLGQGDSVAGIVERQLMRLLEADALLALPMIARREHIGVLVLAVAPDEIKDMRARIPFLQAFAQQAALRLAAMRHEASDDARREADIRTAYQLAGRKLAHEINNPLAIITNYLGVLESRMAKGDIPISALTAIHGEIARVSDLARSFSTLNDATSGALWSLSQRIRQVTSLFRDSGTLASALDIELDLDEPGPSLAFKADALTQILINLFRNASEAMPEGGTIRVTMLGEVNREGQMFYELQISDTGPGMPADVLRNLFKPVSTAKGGEHQGLGLSIVKDLVDACHGHISCRSSSRGTAFTLLLPLPVEALTAA